LPTAAIVADVRSGTDQPAYGRGGALSQPETDAFITHHVTPEQSKPPTGWEPQH
jgi:hypothetical protein